MPKETLSISYNLPKITETAKYQVLENQNDGKYVVLVQTFKLKRPFTHIESQRPVIILFPGNAGDVVVAQRPANRELATQDYEVRSYRNPGLQLESKGALEKMLTGSSIVKKEADLEPLQAVVHQITPTISEWMSYPYDILKIQLENTEQKNMVIVTHSFSGLSILYALSKLLTDAKAANNGTIPKDCLGKIKKVILTAPFVHKPGFKQTGDEAESGFGDSTQNLPKWLPVGLFEGMMQQTVDQGYYDVETRSLADDLFKFATEVRSMLQDPEITSILAKKLQFVTQKDDFMVPPSVVDDFIAEIWTGSQVKPNHQIIQEIGEPSYLKQEFDQKNKSEPNYISRIREAKISKLIQQNHSPEGLQVEIEKLDIRLKTTYGHLIDPHALHSFWKDLPQNIEQYIEND